MSWCGIGLNTTTLKIGYTQLQPTTLRWYVPRNFSTIQCVQDGPCDRLVSLEVTWIVTFNSDHPTKHRSWDKCWDPRWIHGKSCGIHPPPLPWTSPVRNHVIFGRQNQHRSSKPWFHDLLRCAASGWFVSSHTWIYWRNANQNLTMVN